VISTLANVAELRLSQTITTTITTNVVAAFTNKRHDEKIHLASQSHLIGGRMTLQVQKKNRTSSLAELRCGSSVAFDEDSSSC
jgi:hypothetical protein